MADTFVDYAKSYAPPWLLDEWGEKFLGVIGAAKDGKAALAREATKARFADLAPADALMRIGADRVVLQAPGESDDDFRVRLRQAFEIHAANGTEQGIKDLLAPSGSVNVVLTEDQDVAGALGHWARFLIDVFPPHNFVAPVTFGNTHTLGDANGIRLGFGDPVGVDYTKVVTRRWRPAHTRCLGVRINWPIADAVPSSRIFIDDETDVALPDVVDPNAYFAFTFPFWFAG